MRYRKILHIDLDARMGEIRANADYTLIEMPYNLYETHLDQMTWFMDRDEVALSQSKYLPEYAYVYNLYSKLPLKAPRQPGRANTDKRQVD